MSEETLHRCPCCQKAFDVPAVEIRFVMRTGGILSGGRMISQSGKRRKDIVVCQECAPAILRRYHAFVSVITGRDAIAAAPELLAAIGPVTDMAGSEWGEDDERVERARAAIAKSEGKS